MSINNKKIVAFMPAKGTSNRVENKNLRLLDGLPLYLHAIKKLMSCEFIDEVYLDTESDSIITMAKDTGCRIIKRDPSLATNTTDGNKLLMNEIENVKSDIYVQLLCTSPFIEIETIKIACSLVANDGNYDSVTLVKKEKQYRWNDSKPLYDIKNIPNSNTLEDTIIETMGLYVITDEAANKTKRRIGEQPYLLEVTPVESVDVNWPDDFYLAENIAAGLREQKRKHLNIIKNHLSSPMLSDILDDLGYKNQIITKLIPNYSTKILGYAKTLKLRSLGPNEDPKGIYDALKSYKWVVPNDIIVVENEASEFAYFGELNANLAMREGAVGAIVGGVTRDKLEVTRIGFPVFSSGSNCQDVRGRATVESWNRTINLFGVTVPPDSLIFADDEGVVVIPKEIEKKTLQLAFDTIRNENSILTEIALGIDVNSLVDKYGNF